MKNILTLGAMVAALAAGEAQAGHGPFLRTRCVQQRVCSRRWVPGHYEFRLKEVYVPGHRQKVWVEPVYREVCIGRFTVKIQVCSGHYKTVWIEGTYKTERCKVWVPGRWVEC